MEENEYKSTYNTLTTIRCVFEKALTSNQASCHLAKHFCLADREGYACENKEAAARCSDVLEKLRKNSSFVLKLHEVDGPLPHNMEIRVQVGGVTGIVKSITGEAELVECIVAAEPSINAASPRHDIDHAISEAVTRFGSLEAFPYSEIMQSVVKFQGRRKRQL